MRARLQRSLRILVGSAILLAGLAANPVALAQQEGFDPSPTGEEGRGAPRSSSVRMDVRAGFDGQGRLGGWLPLEIELVNQGAEVRAEVQVTVGPNSVRGVPTQTPTVFSLPVVLPRLSHKRFTMEASIPSTNTKATARLVGAAGETLAEQEIGLGRVPLGDYFCGIFARDPSSYDFLEALELPPPIRRVRTAPLEPATIPDRAQLLGSFDCIIVDNAATSQLRQEQLDAIRVWVGTGGLLVAVGGPTWQSTLGPLPPGLLPVEPTGFTQVASLAALGEAIETEVDPSLGPWLVTQARARTDRGGRVLAAQDGVPLLAAAKRGEGTVLYLGFEPTARALRGWAGADHLWRYVMVHAAVDNGIGSALVRPYLRWGRAPRIGMADFTGHPRTNLDWLWKLLAGYTIVLTASLFVLGRRGFTGGSVAAVVVLSGVGALAAFSAARQHAEPEAGITRLSVIRPIESGDAAAAYTREYLSFLARRDGAYSFTLPSDSLTRGLFFPAPRPSDGADQDWRFRLQQGVTPTIEGLELRQGQLATAILDGQIGQVGGALADLRIEGNALTGTLANRTPGRLTDAYVVIDGNSFQRLGTIERDELRQVDVTLPRQAGAGSMAASALAAQLVPQELQVRPGGAARRDLLESLFFDRFLFRRMEMRGPTLVAWLEHPVTTIEPRDFRVSKQDFSLLVQPLQPRLPRGFEGEVPAATMNRRDLGIGSGTPTDQPYYSVSQGESVTLQFALPATEGYYQQRHLRVNVEGSFTGRTRGVQPPVTISLFNWRAAEWQAWDVVVGTTIIPEGDRYLSAVGEVRLRYTLEASPANPIREVRFTRLDVTSLGMVR